MVYAGTAVTYGRGRAVVVATGMHTEFGKIAQLLQTVETGKTPLQENLDKVGHALARAALVVVAVIVGARPVPRPAVPRDADLRHRAGGGRRAGGAARRRHHLAGHRRAAHGQAQRADPPPARRRDAGQHLGHLLRQDRHADQGRDDRPQVLVAGQMLDVSGAGYEPRGEFSHDGSAVEPSGAGHRDCCAPPRSPPTRTSFATRPTAAGTSRATRPRARWSWPPPRPGCTRPTSTRSSRASTRSPSPPRPSA